MTYVSRRLDTLRPTTLYDDRTIASAAGDPIGGGDAVGEAGDGRGVRGAGARRRGVGRGLHSSIFQLNLSRI